MRRSMLLVCPTSETSDLKSLVFSFQLEPSYSAFQQVSEQVFSKMAKCRECGGSGYLGEHICTKCGGKGEESVDAAQCGKQHANLQRWLVQRTRLRYSPPVRHPTPLSGLTRFLVLLARQSGSALSYLNKPAGM